MKENLREERLERLTAHEVIQRKEFEGYKFIYEGDQSLFDLIDEDQ